MQNPLEILALPASTQTAAVLRQLLGQDRNYHCIQLPPGSSRLPASLDAPDVLLYELPVPGGDGLEALQALRAQLAEDVSLIVTGATDSPGLMRSLMQLGVRDVLHEPLDPAELTATLARVQAEKQAAAPARRSTVAAFCNAHGSSGATLLAVNTAITLAQQQGARVALIDFDLQFGKVAHLLDLKPATHVLDALRDAHRLDEVFLKALMAEHESGVHVLAAPPTLAPLELSTTAVRKLIGVAAASYDIVILDLPRLVSEWTLQAMAECDRVLLLTQNNLGALRDTRRLLDYLSSAGELPADRIEVVNNRALSRQASTSIEQMKKILGRPRLHRVRNDYSAALSAEDQGLPLYRVAPQSALTQDSERLAGHLWQLHHPGAALASHKAPRWFDRLRGLQVQATPAG